LGNQAQVTLMVLRPSTWERLTFTIIPRKVVFDYYYVPISTRDKITVRASKVGVDKTEVKIINYQEGDFGYPTQFGWRPDYKAIETSTVVEKILLDRIDAEIGRK